MAGRDGCSAKKATYLMVITLAERLHRRTLNLLHRELNDLGFEDLNAAQAMMVVNVGEQEMSVGELTRRGCYQGSNVSYSLSALVTNGYLLQERSAKDKRVTRIRVSERGRELLQKLDVFFHRLAERSKESGIGEDFLLTGMPLLAELERFTVQQADRSVTRGDITDEYSAGARL